MAGNLDGSHIYRSLLYFNLDGIPTGPDVFVDSLQSYLSVYSWHSPSCTATPLQVWGLGSVAGGGAFADNVTWNSQPPVLGTTPVSTTSFANGPTGCAPARRNLDVYSLAQSWLQGTTPNRGLQLRAANEADPAQLKVLYSGDTGYGNTYAPFLQLTYNRQPTAITPVAPAAGARLATTTPTLSVTPATDPDGGLGIFYMFTVATNPDGETGAALNSGWLTQPSFAVTPGALRDGMTYWWKVWVWDASTGPPRGPTTVQPFSIDLRLGHQGTNAYDDAGPAMVNLASGNLVVSAASPMFPTVGGGMGLSFTYNSQQPAVTGLVGEYFNDPGASRSFAGKSPAMVRHDPRLQFNWAAGSPGPAIAADNFLVRWKGFVTVPQSGAWRFGAGHDNGVRIEIGTTTVLDQWSSATPSSCTTGPWAFCYHQGPLSVALTAGVPVAIEVEYAEWSELAGLVLWGVGPHTGQTSPPSYMVPSSWLTAQTPSLPQGWTMAAAPALRLGGRLRALGHAARRLWQPPHLAVVGLGLSSAGRRDRRAQPRSCRSSQPGRQRRHALRLRRGRPPGPGRLWSRRPPTGSPGLRLVGLAPAAAHDHRPRVWSRHHPVLRRRLLPAGALRSGCRPSRDAVQGRLH